MTLEAKYTAGPFADEDEWQTPISALAHQILDSHLIDGDQPSSVSVQFSDGQEITYRLSGTAEQAEADDDAWLAGYLARCALDLDDSEEQEPAGDQDEEFECEQIGWARYYFHQGEEGWTFHGLSEDDDEEELSNNGWVPVWA